ncbi:hypothetical protein B0H11DRAFT_2224464 [Mycena galericulata]|nr:hypothetical protein B0H11DRAFT_2224464 [Mycena galericulata]
MNTLIPYVFLALFSTVHTTALQKRDSVSANCNLNSFVFAGGALTATCSGTASNILLDTCIGQFGNNNGDLGVGQNFSAHCSQIALNGTILSAECPNLDGSSTVGSQVNLDTVVNGVLTCHVQVEPGEGT